MRAVSRSMMVISAVPAWSADAARSAKSRIKMTSG